MDGVGVISACSRGGGAQHQTPQRGQAHAVHPRPPPPSRGPPPPPLPPSPSTSTVAITTTTATTTTAAANAANTTNVTILITVTRVNTTAIVSSVSSDEQAGAVVSWKDTEAIDSIQVSFANAAMALKEEETDEMQKLVAEQKYVDKDFPLPDEHCLRPHELVGKPKMFVDGPSHMDIIQENLGDCWFLAAASVVAQHPELIHQEGDWKQGIPGRHAYSVTGVYTVRAGDNIVRLVRVRNPWGASAYTVEWKGAFSDKYGSPS
ncbi:Protein of unknown function [Gryllus bimaculatus]|nr:Protein of unknown function [Gryllus bimaculatus]